MKQLNHSKNYKFEELTNDIETKTLLYEIIDTSVYQLAIKKAKLSRLRKIFPNAELSYSDQYLTDNNRNVIYIIFNEGHVYTGFVKESRLNEFILDSNGQYAINEMEIDTKYEQKIFIKKYIRKIRFKKQKSRNKDNNAQSNSCTNTRESYYTIIDDPTQR